MLNLNKRHSRYREEAPRLVSRCRLTADLLDRAQSLAQACAIHPVVAQLLVARGITTVVDAQSFLAPALRTGLPDPVVMRNVRSAAEELLAATEDGRQITVFHDFDVDGICGGAQLVLYLRALGARVVNYTPSRFTEGYGLTRTAIEKLARAHTQLLVAVDCGTTNQSELLAARRAGMRTIVIDHHQLQGESAADILINPEQDGCPFQEHKLCAAGLVWMLLIVLRQLLRKNAPDPKEYLDLAALGTICDMVPLTGVNRIIASRGLEALALSERPGIRALQDVAGLRRGSRLNVGHVGFGLGPRINAAGRLSSAQEAFQLLTTDDPAQAQQLAQKLDALNLERKTIEEDIQLAALEMLATAESVRPALCVFGEKFHLGVLGIVAQRLVEQFFRPAAVMGLGEATIEGRTQTVIKGSVRSIPGFHVAQVLDALADLLLAHGGHSEAGGFTLPVDSLAHFQQRFVAEAERRLSAEQLRRSVTIDCELPFSQIDYRLVEQIQAIAPFGIGNPCPVFTASAVVIESVTSLSETHLRLRFSDGQTHLTAVAWGFGGHPLIRKGARVHIAFTPELSTYQGITSVQLNLKEIWSDTEETADRSAA